MLRVKSRERENKRKCSQAESKAEEDEDENEGENKQRPQDRQGQGICTLRYPECTYSPELDRIRIERRLRAAPWFQRLSLLLFEFPRSNHIFLFPFSSQRHDRLPLVLLSLVHSTQHCKYCRVLVQRKGSHTYLAKHENLFLHMHTTNKKYDVGGVGGLCATMYRYIPRHSRSMGNIWRAYSEGCHSTHMGHDVSLQGWRPVIDWIFV